MPADLDGHVGAGTDGHPDIGLGQRRGVVHAVTDHRHPLAAFLETRHSGSLVSGQHLGGHLVDAAVAGRPSPPPPGCRR